MKGRSTENSTCDLHKKASIPHLLGVVGALDKLPTTSSEPIAEILGDNKSRTLWQRWKKIIKNLCGSPVKSDSCKRRRSSPVTRTADSFQWVHSPKTSEPFH